MGWNQDAGREERTEGEVREKWMCMGGVCPWKAQEREMHSKLQRVPKVEFKN